MSYESGFLKDRVTIIQKVNPSEQGFGETTRYEPVLTVWANVSWLKGIKRLAEATLDAQDTVMIRMRWNCIVTRDSRLEHDGTLYQIQSLHRDRQDNTLQITATEIVR